MRLQHRLLAVPFPSDERRDEPLVLREQHLIPRGRFQGPFIQGDRKRVAVRIDSDCLPEPLQRRFSTCIDQNTFKSMNEYDVSNRI